MNHTKAHMILAALMVLLLQDSAGAQSHNRGRNWMFGYGNGLDFSTVPPTPVSSQCDILEGAGTMSDDNGNLLFYCDDRQLWNRNHAQMPNGNGLYLTATTTMGALITPFLTDSNKYYVFQVDGSSAASSGNCGPMGKWDGLMYHVVDMALDGGKGDVVPGMKNVILTDSTSEKLTAVMHENGSDYWIITRKAFVSDYYCYLVTDSGICPDPVISSTGNISSTPNNPTSATIGALIPSHDGKALVNIERSNDLPQIGDFDASTGKVTDMHNLSSTQGDYYSASFSPNDSIIYVNKINNNQPVTVLQYQRHAIDIPMTELSISGTGANGDIWAMRNWGDTIYCASADSSYHIIADPNNYGSPNIQAYVQAFTSSTFSQSPKMGTSMGNFFYYHYDSTKNIQFTSFSDTIICIGDNISLGMPALVDYQYEWFPPAGLDDPFSSNPNAQPDSTTEYVLKATFHCKIVYDTVTIYIPTIEAGNDVVICNGDSVVLTATQGSTYLWTTGDTMASIIVSPSATITYYVTATGTACPPTDSVTVTVNQPPSALTIAGPDQLCEGSSISLTAQGPGPYVWSTGDTQTTITISPNASTTYWVQSTNDCGTSSDTVNIAVNQLPVLQVSDDVEIGIGSITTLTVSGAETYLWNNDADTDSIMVSPTQTVTYYVTGYDSMGCSADASVLVIVTSLSSVYLPNVFSSGSINPENEKLYVFGKNINNLELIIYDRWGTKVHETNSTSKKMRSDGQCCTYGEGWDGTFKNTGKPLNGAVFVFKLKGKFENGEKFYETGNITLIK